MEIAMNFSFGLALDELAYEYECMTGDSNPPKLCAPLDRPDEDGWLRRYLNIMSAVLSDGTFGSKTIFVDEVAGLVGGDVLHYGANGRRLYSLPASLVTPLRCAMMAALALQYRRQGPADGRRVMVLGRGEIGVATCQVLHKLRDELCIEEIYSVGGERQWHNAKRLPREVNLSVLDDAFQDESESITTLITATNHSGATIEPGHRGLDPLELVSFDGGCLLGPGCSHGPPRGRFSGPIAVVRNQKGGLISLLISGARDRGFLGHAIPGNHL